MKLKSIILIVLLFFSSVQMAANEDVIDEISDIEGVTTVYISKSMLGLMKGIGSKAAGIDIGDVVSKLNSITILTSNNTKSVAKMRVLSKSLQTNLEKSQYEKLMKVKDNKSKVDMYVKKRKEIITSLIMIVDEEREFVVLSFDGHISLQDIQKLLAQVK